MKKRNWFWVVLFIFAACLLGTLATSWNVIIFRSYNHWMGILLGSLGFMATFTATLLFFIRLLQEMKLNQLQTEFLAQVSHELKTPLATMELTSSLLRSGQSSPVEVDRLWASHQAELNRLKREVETLLEAARWETRPQKRPRLSKVNLEQWIHECWPRWQSILGPNSQLSRCGDPLPGFALISPRLMELVTNNLVDNARKFARNAPTLIVRTEMIRNPRQKRFRQKCEARWRLHFEDQGWGFQPREARKVFTRFYRARTAAPYAIAGTGLGLHLAASASRAQGISIRGHSEGPGSGAAFTLEGPLWNS